MADLCLVQARLCAQLGSTMYARLLDEVAVDVRLGGPAWQVLQQLAGCPEGDYPALRLLGSVHGLVLQGRAPELALHYPSVGGAPQDGLWDQFRAVLEDHRQTLRGLVTRAPQTNEVGRSAALLGGFATVSTQTGLPLRTLEIGSSAGLNLLWDAYRYRSGSWSWGDPLSPVVLDDVFDGPVPSVGAVTVDERAGCDLTPVDVATEEGRLTLLAFVWPDQQVRRRRLEAAIQVFRASPSQPRVERADALSWLERQLAEPSTGTATVVTHSVVTTYLDRETNAALDELLARHGRRATMRSPLARLSVESVTGGPFEIRLRTWPGDNERLLGHAGGHGLPVVWKARGLAHPAAAITSGRQT
ncbi:DUF2332 domain-containing protein [Jannaschia sp. R86511]|uniref:DUF2332 domain-containing protein n=1 Tax=Jannaschia sp. R86511 TaxID=3093853 RepID=UPI0036D2155A